MKKMILPKERPEYIPNGIYQYPKEERKDIFLKMFPIEDDEMMNIRRKENLRELRGDYH